jgi:hypothetical protein
MPELKPSLIVNKNPQFYFSDIDYTDYRELVCFERPACFVAHYYFGFKSFRLWLFDRFAFEFSDGYLTSKHNALKTVLEEQGIASSEDWHTSNGTLADLLSTRISENSAVVLPLETRFGNAVTVTSVLVESISDPKVLYTSLRGDDFFIRKSTSLESLEERLHVENCLVQIHTIADSNFLQLNKDKSPETLWRDLNLAAEFKKTFDDFYGDEPFRALGFESLVAFQQHLDRGYGHYKKLVTEGFHNVLLSQIFWPMLFAYSPFLVFLRNATRIQLDGLNTQHIDGLLLEISKSAQIVTNLGLMFAKQPSARVYDRFQESLRSLCEHYKRIEIALPEVMGGMPRE